MPSTTTAASPTSRSSTTNAARPASGSSTRDHLVRSRGVQLQRVLTDNGPGYCSATFTQACARHQIRPLRTRPYRPRTNGKAERFIQTMLHDWAYAVRYQTSDQRNLALTPWIEYYNQRRPRSALGHKAPDTRLPAA